MYSFSAVLFLCAILRVENYPTNDYSCPEFDRTCTESPYENQNMVECNSDFNCGYGYKCCDHCKYNYKVCWNVGFKKHKSDENLKDKYIEDAKALEKAFKAWDCDMKTVMDIIIKRSYAERKNIAVQFKTLYGKDLIEELESELTGNFEEVIVGLMIPPVEYYAKQLYEAISGMGTNENTIIDILGIHKNADIVAIRDAYQRLYGNSLESDINGDTSGSVNRLMISLVTAERDESSKVGKESAYNDARTLLRAGELFAGTDESAFNQVLCQRNKPQLQLIFDEYKSITGHDFEKAIENEFSGTAEDVFLALVKCIRSPAEHLADRLYESMDGNGTDDATLIWIMVSRADYDLGEIKDAFLRKYGKTLADFIQDDTSGDYRTSLLSLVEKTLCL